MKSLIEEASSISKAIEKAWERAGRPHSFSVKIFELPEKNFIGMTTKYAKIGVFFEDKKTPEIHSKPIEKTGSTPIKKPFEKKHPANTIINSKSKENDSVETLKPVEVIKKHKTKTHSSEDRTRQTHQAEPKSFVSDSEQPQLEITATWNEDMKMHLKSWLKEVLVLIGLPQIEFACQEQKNILKVNFDSPLIGNELKESLLYKNLSYLGMVSLRTHFKNEMKHLKILLSRE